MAMVLAAGVSLDGFRLYVHNRISYSLSLSVFQVKENPKETKKPEFVNFKRMVWHKSIFQVTHSKTSCWLECGDGVRQWLFPTVIILSADYEEQYVFLISWRCVGS
jgi:hypothetical protein